MDEVCAQPAAATSWCSCPASARSARPPKRCASTIPQAAEILPLFARLSAEEQERVFQPGGARRIVLATNVAETSLTVPGIRYVIDTGFARVNRYSYRNKVEQLQIEKISQASANQRAGRCGRVAAGVCIRLYGEEDFDARAAVHRPGDPALVAGGGDPAHEGAGPRRRRGFPVPRAARSPRMIADGYQLLEELGAVDEQQRADRPRPAARASSRSIRASRA